MPDLEPTSPDDVARAILAAGPPLALLDFDGTLSPIVDDPEAAAPAVGALAAVRRVAAVMPVALVSGRPVDDLLRRIPADLPVTLAGGHGAEVRTPDGAHDTLIDLDEVTPTLDRLERALLETVDQEVGWYVERKPTGVAVHHRRVRGAVQPVLDEVRRHMQAVTDTPPGFGFVDGKAVTEVRVAGIDKGGVVRRLAAEWPDRTPFFVGDDVTDEDAFVACNDLGGCTVVVAEAPRPTAAALRLTSPGEVVAMLNGLAALMTPGAP
jgi:trehalose-phosphatase